MKPESRSVHAGRELGARSPLAPPIFATAVYVYDDLEDYDNVAAGEVPGHIYGRNSNENVAMLESALAELEGGEAGQATSSGMAAILLALLSLAPRPCPIVAPRDSYGVTLALLHQDFEPAGYEIRLADYDDLEGVGKALAGAGLVLLETISNPLCKVADLEAICALAAERGIPSVVDNTFATPLLCRPLELGASLVVHSVTKFLGGHSDLIAGAVLGRTPEMAPLRARAVRLGTTLGPFEAWLALRGLRTLGLRMSRHSSNSLALAGALEGMPGVSAVHHPLLSSSPYRDRAGRLLPGGVGGMMAFDLAGGREAVQAMMNGLRMVRFAASLGGVETTISHPELTSHRSLSPAQRAELGIGSGTVRVSVGIEAPEDIVADFRSALGG
jgi:methionine-gamma-lyase